MTEPRRRSVRDRDVLIAAALVVVVVVIVARLSGHVPAIDDALGYAPLVIAVLIGGTVVVLFWALRPRG